jgi:hypothetical protein
MNAFPGLHRRNEEVLGVLIGVATPPGTAKQRPRRTASVKAHFRPVQDQGTTLCIIHENCRKEAHAADKNEQKLVLIFCE